MRLTATGSYRTCTCFPGPTYYNTAGNHLQWTLFQKNIDMEGRGCYSVQQGIFDVLKKKRVSE